VDERIYIVNNIIGLVNDINHVRFIPESTESAELYIR